MTVTAERLTEPHLVGRRGDREARDAPRSRYTGQVVVPASDELHGDLVEIVRALDPGHERWRVEFGCGYKTMHQALLGADGLPSARGDNDAAAYYMWRECRGGDAHLTGVEP
jgi:hypothetical protein